MRLARLGAVGEEIPVALVDGIAFDLRPVTSDIDAAFWRERGARRVRDALDRGILAPLPGAAGLRIGAPLARPGVVVCIGMNYAAHAAESGSPPPELPVMFLKPPNTIGGPFDDVPLPRRATRTDWEVELGVVIGASAHSLDTDEDALSCVAGYVLANDVSERRFQLEESGGQWSKGKAAPGFTPLGPWVTTSDEFDPSEVGLRSWVNGSPRQDSRSSDMVFGIAALVRHLSQYMRLDPGDVVLTGTPEGVALSGRFPYLTAGDVCAVEIDGLGRQEHRFV
ncbi:fumarylacetoacetate hydrolase family protein [Salinibacterium soli]|uniref:Fumarylacetoacetate hydrolase family protein n=1 Tax=Antiquaquibacter soli TaxID=3064523 RepID=A0ABT9BQK2_9MICO|nr:fumarylacetoacetate hydrolase family protein [Protaetiibacter sp. WY-16]MDO7882712.1 fumarylacetoacetate hydrolase family protein [Protaetiibacter sp. WY-16]